MNSEFIHSLEILEKERGIPKDSLIEALEKALAAAGKKHLNVRHKTIANVDPETGEMQVFTHREVVKEVEDYETQISLEDAKAINKKYKKGDFVDILIDPNEFGRIAAMTARHVVLQGIREAERNIAFSEFESQKGEIVQGNIMRIDRGNIIVELGKLECVLTAKEQIPGEVWKQGDKIRVYIVDVAIGGKGAVQLYVSRTNPGMVKKLFEREIPEVANGTIEVKGIAREPGARSKVSVVSNDANVDARGACIGANGIRVKSIVTELHGEKIDVVQYHDNIEDYVVEALSPAQITNVKANEADKICTVVVPDNQLSLAIGKEGQNARLAARLTGWKIDIKSESFIAGN